jgi:hypothetical protein
MHGDRGDQGRYGQPRRSSGDKDTDPADGSFPGIGASYLADLRDRIVAQPLNSRPIRSFIEKTRDEGHRCLPPAAQATGDSPLSGPRLPACFLHKLIHRFNELIGLNTSQSPVFV